MKNVSVGMKGQILFGKPTGACIEMIVRVKAQVDQLDKDPRGKWD